MMAELAGKATGISKGRGGSMHLDDRQKKKLLVETVRRWWLCPSSRSSIDSAIPSGQIILLLPSQVVLQLTKGLSMSL